MDEAKNTIDPHSGNEIRRTDNDLKCGDVLAPQHTRPLTVYEIREQLTKAKAGDADGNC